MKTKFPYNHIEYDKYFNDYFKREDAITMIPSKEEMLELAHKGIVKAHIELKVLPEGTKAEEGDTLTLRTESVLPKFNKEKVTISIGRGLYDKTLEKALVGKRVGERTSVTVKEEAVTAEILEIKRKIVPEPTDAMVVEMQEKDYQGNLIQTVAEYEKFMIEGKRSEALANINYFVTEAIIQDYPMTEYEESDIVILGQLERDMFRDIFMKEKGIDLLTCSKEEMQENLHCDSMEEFITMRHEWYQMKIQQCLIFLDILGLPCEGKTDPLDHYEVLSELQEKMFNLIEKKMKERNA